MQRNIKLAIAMAILVFGLSAALLFRRESSATADGGTTPEETLPYRSAANTAAEPTAVTFSGAVATAAPPVMETTAVAPWSTTVASSQFGGSASAPGQQTTVPTLPPHYDPSGPVSSPPLPPPPSATDPAAPVLPPPPPGTSPQAVPHVPPTGRGAASLMPPLRTHRIADGDTLGRIAAKYLDEAARQKEILELNREVLGDNPDLLPIGAVLKIPAAAPATNGRPGSADAATGAGGASELVPIPAGALRH